MTINKTICFKDDANRESSCEFAEADVALGCFVCKNECVKRMSETLDEKDRKIWHLESVIGKYREAFSPFVGVCRKVVEAADGQKEANK